MEKSAEQITKILGLNYGTVNTILSRPELYKYKNGTVYEINKGFIDNLYDYIEKRRKQRNKTRKKYEMCQMKLYKWRMKLNENKKANSRKT